jgi:hypothetical protein
MASEVGNMMFSRGPIQDGHPQWQRELLDEVWLGVLCSWTHLVVLSVSSNFGRTPAVLFCFLCETDVSDGNLCAPPTSDIFVPIYINIDRERHVFVFTLFVIMTHCLIPKGEKFWWWHTSQIRKVSKLTNILESSLVFSFAIVSPARSFRAVRCSATVCYSAWWSRNRRARLAGEATLGAELRGLTNHFVGFNMFQPTKHAICTQNW